MKGDEIVYFVILSENSNCKLVPTIIFKLPAR